MRLRHIPADYTAADINEKLGYAIYHGVSRKESGYPVSMRFIGKQSRPADYYRFKTDEERRASDARFIENMIKIQEMKTATRKARYQPHTLKVGDILYSSWGYEQTNVDFYQVTEIKGKSSVVIRKIAGKSVGETGWASDTVVAEKDNFVGEPQIKRANHSNRISFESYKSAGLWDGRPLHRSWYA